MLMKFNIFVVLKMGKKTSYNNIKYKTINTLRLVRLKLV